MDVGASSSHPRRSHGSLRPPRQSKEWSSIGQNRWRNVWITPGRAPSLRSTCQASQTPWLFPLQAYCRPLEAQNPPNLFCLTVDDFGVKHVGKEHADHLIQALNSKYKITTDWEGRLYCGIQLEWNYEAKWVDLSMPNYVKEMRHKFQQHDRPSMRHVDGIVRRMARDPSCQNRKTTHHHSTPKASTKFNRWWAAPCTMVEQLIQQYFTGAQ